MTDIRLPLDYYCKGEPFMREKSALFANEWLPVCARAQLVRTGDYLGHVIAGWPVVAVRDADTVRLFRNTCRHQNMMVLEKSSGQCDVIQCRYHGWQYRLDGTFLAAPPLVAPADPRDAGNHLAALSSAEFTGLMMGRFGSDSGTFTPQPEASALVAAAFAGEPPVLAGSFVTELACNWKVVVEHELSVGTAFEWPLLLLRAAGPGIEIVQIVPRSFLRTRLVSYLLARGASASAPAATLDELRARIGQVKAASEAHQEQIARGDHGTARGESVQRFRRRVLESADTEGPQTP